MRRMKKMMIGILTASLIVANIPVQTLMAIDFNEGTVNTEPVVTSVEFEPIVMFEGETRTYESQDEEGNWFDVEFYDYIPQATITFNDGQVVTSDDGWFEYNNESYYLPSHCTDNQSRTNLWEVGPHSVSVDLFGYKTSFIVTIIESPIASIECQEMDILEGYNWHACLEYDYEIGDYVDEWLCYDYRNEATVTFKDGTVVTSQYGRIQYSGKDYYITYSDDQSYTNQWQAGHTYTVNASLLGCEDEFLVNILPSPIQSIECDPLEIVEGTTGYTYDAYDEQTGEYLGEYFCYDMYPTFTVTLTDGTVISNLRGSFIYQGEEYPLTWDDDQSYENQWTVGNTYIATAELLGRYDEFEVTIVEADDSGNTGGSGSDEDENTYIMDAFTFSISTDDAIIPGNDVTLQIDVKNNSGQELSSLGWFTHWYYQVQGNSDAYPGVEFGTLADAEGNVLEHMSSIDIAFAVNETKSFTLTGKIPDTWNSQSAIILVIGSEVGNTTYYGQEEFLGYNDGGETPPEDDPEDEIVKQTGTVKIGNATGKVGEEVNVSLSFEEEVSIKSIAITQLSYDSSKLKLVDGEWTINGILSDWGSISEAEGVLAFANNTLVEGTFFTLTFQILDNVEDCEIPISCKVTANEILDSNEEIAIDITTVAGQIEVENVIRGDFDGNGFVTSDDAIYLLYHTTMSDNYPINQNGDVDNDGSITSNDAIYLLYHTMLPGTYPLN